MDTHNFFKGNMSGISSILEMLVPPAIVVVSLVAISDLLGGRFNNAHIILAMLAALLVFIVTSQRMDRMQTPTDGLFSLTGRILVEWSIVVGILLLIGFATKYTDYFSRQILFIWAVVSPACIVASLYAIRMFALRYALRSNSVRKSVIVGISKSSAKLAEKIGTTPALGLDLLGFFYDEEKEGREFAHRKLGGLDDAVRYVRENGIDTVFISMPMQSTARVLALVSKLRDSTVSVYFVPDILVFDLVQSEVKTLRGVPVISLCETPLSGRRYLAKRTMDLVGSFGLLILFAPLMLALALCVKASSPGPALFKQRRYGLDGAEILVYKFRTMTVMEDGDQVAQAQKNDKRVTRIGRFLRRSSLDELPQLFNVLKGEMSLVGPRPHAVAHNEEYRSRIEGYMQRHKVMPGMTGWAQVNGFRGETKKLAAMEGRVQYDLEYLRNWSIWLDLRILARTLSVIIHDDKAY